MAKFQLDKTLERDCMEICNLRLSKLLLMNDSRFLWCILVPMQEGLTELYQLSKTDNNILNDEIIKLSKILSDEFHADKINIGSLGNIVSQLHIHVVARKVNDPAWPLPVWGYEKPVKYKKSESVNIIKLLRIKFNNRK